MVITIEPGIYIPGKYGARYEEMILVSEKWLLLL
jgi:Xaa-Pro aminopeptidase